MRRSDLGARIANARVRRGVSRRALASYCGMNEERLYRIETGARPWPDGAEINLVAKALLLRVEDLRDGGLRWEQAVARLKPITVLGLLMDEAKQYPPEATPLSEDRFPAFREKEQPQAPVVVPKPDVRTAPPRVALSYQERRLVAIWTRLDASLREEQPD